MWGLRWIAGIGIGMALLVPVIVAAQTGTSIQYGETVSGDVSADVACQYYWFEGVAGDAITADMSRTSGSLDGVLSLYLHDDFTADPVAFNDDRSGGGLDPLITVTLPATDWYTLAACRLQHENMRVTVGTFDLTLSGTEGAPGAVEEEASEGGAAVPTAGASITEGIFPSEAGDQPTATPTPASSGGTITEGVFSSTDSENATDLIEAGSTVSGQLDSNVPQADYQLEVHAGELITIDWQRTSGNLSPVIKITGSDGKLIAVAATQDAVSTLQLVFVAPTDGVVGIAIARYGEAVDATAGAYEIVVVITPDVP